MDGTAGPKTARCVQPAIRCIRAPPRGRWRRVGLMAEDPTHARSTRWLWIAAIWCAGALFDASQNVLIMRSEGRQHSWLPLFGTELALWLPWALATPFIGRLARR